MHVAPLSAKLYCFSLTSPSFLIIHLLATFAHKTNKGKNIPSPISAMAHPKKNEEGKGMNNASAWTCQSNKVSQASNTRRTHSPEGKADNEPKSIGFGSTATR